MQKKQKQKETKQRKKKTKNLLRWKLIFHKRIIIRSQKKNIYNFFLPFSYVYIYIFYFPRATKAQIYRKTNKH